MWSLYDHGLGACTVTTNLADCVSQLEIIGCMLFDLECLALYLIFYQKPIRTDIMRMPL